MDVIQMKIAASVPEYPQDDWSVVGSTVVTGMVVVFAILIILVFFLWLLGQVLGEKTKKGKNENQIQLQQAESSAPQAEIIEDDTLYEDDGEIIAVISAAIAAFGDADGKQYKVVGVKRKDKALRSGWGLAGVSENTRPF